MSYLHSLAIFDIIVGQFLTYVQEHTEPAPGSIYEEIKTQYKFEHGGIISEHFNIPVNEFIPRLMDVITNLPLTLGSKDGKKYQIELMIECPDICSKLSRCYGQESDTDDVSTSPNWNDEKITINFAIPSMAKYVPDHQGIYI